MAKAKRNRQIKTCEYCYSHKLKCDRNTPCATCIRTKTECVYQFKQLKRDDSADVLPSDDLKKDSDANPENSELNSNLTNNKGADSSKTVFLSNVNNTPLYYSRAFFPYLEPSLNRMFLFKMSEVGESSAFAHFSAAGTYDFQRFGLQMTIENLVDEYPKKEEFDDIIYFYWDYIHPLIPVIDKETTMARYIKFWNDLNSEDGRKFDIDCGVLFLSMLLAVRTAFEVNESSPEKLEEIQKAKNKLYDTYEKFKLIFGFKTNPNLAYIQSSIILFQSSAIYYMGIFTYTAALSRQAEFMGLHRDPLLHDVYPNKKRMKDAEVRRLVWHYVRFLDTASSLVSGMSPHMIMTNASAKFPSKRDYNPTSHKFDGDLNPFMIFTIVRFKCSLVMETVSHYLNSDFASEDEKVMRWEGISKTVTALYQDVFILIKEIFGCGTNPKYSKVLLRWLVSNAAIITHRTYLLHRTCDRRPYSHHNRVILKPANASSVELTKLSQSNSSKEFFDKVLTIRMPYSDVIVEVVILLLYESKMRVSDSPELTKFKWFTKNANPFQYIYFVLRDLYHYPTKRYKFENLPQEIKSFIFENDLFEYEGDLRKYVADIALTSLLQLKDYWCEPLSDMMNFLFELKKYVYTTLNINVPGSETTQTAAGSADTPANEFENGEEKEFEIDKYRNVLNIFSKFGGGDTGSGMPVGIGSLGELSAGINDFGRDSPLGSNSSVTESQPSIVPESRQAESFDVRKSQNLSRVGSAGSGYLSQSVNNEARFDHSLTPQSSNQNINFQVPMNSSTNSDSNQLSSEPYMNMNQMNMPPQPLTLIPGNPPMVHQMQQNVPQHQMQPQPILPSFSQGMPPNMNGQQQFNGLHYGDQISMMQQNQQFFQPQMMPQMNPVMSNMPPAMQAPPSIDQTGMIQDPSLLHRNPAIPMNNMGNGAYQMQPGMGYNNLYTPQNGMNNRNSSTPGLSETGVNLEMNMDMNNQQNFR